MIKFQIKDPDYFQGGHWVTTKPEAKAWLRDSNIADLFRMVRCNDGVILQCIREEIKRREGKEWYRI